MSVAAKPEESKELKAATPATSLLRYETPFLVFSFTI